MACQPPGAVSVDPIGRALYRASAALAVLGGLLLAAIMVMVVVSIIGRNLAGVPLFGWLGPVPGDFELVELGVAIALFSFLPYCQIVRGNVAVDFFVAKASARTRAWFAVAGNLLYTIIAALLAWQLFNGYLDRLGPYGETTWILGLPTKWGYLCAVVATVLLALVCAYTVLRSIAEARGSGEPVR
ncbi:MAG: TRAP transporter small permease [Pseudomonadota bacterium]